MKQVYKSTERGEAVRAKRVLEEHLIPCLLITNGKGVWKIYLNVASYAPEFGQISAQVDDLIRQYGLEG
jgi:hypothetical protein